MLKSDFQYRLFPRHSKPLNNGQSPIYLRIEHHSSRRDVATGVSCAKEMWDSNFKRIKGGEMVEESNLILTQWEEKARNAINELFDEEEYFTVDDVKDHIHGKRKVKGLIEFFTSRHEELKDDSDYSPNTLKVYNTTLLHLKNFLRKKLKRSEYPLKKVDYTFISNLFSYLKNSCGCNTNSANKYLKTLKAVLNEARHQSLLIRSPFETYKIKAGKYNRTFLNEDELTKIIEADLKDPKLDLVRDFFLFVCFTGFHYSDVKSLRQNHIINRNGQKWILKPRTKNGEEALLPLLRTAEAIVSKHSKLPKKENELLMMYSNQKTNQYLKDLAAECEIDSRITCRVGRHTFATTVTLTNQVPLESVSHMLGHSSIKTTQIYARVVNSKLLRDMQRVVAKY